MHSTAYLHPVGNKKAAEAAYKSLLLLLLFQLNQMHKAINSGRRIALNE
ncbi:MAG: hypothetical protein ACI909_004273, partial [Planctomycetota bacterium]